MKALQIPKTEDTPKINFSPEKDVFEISDRSLPENAIEFYKPILDWFKSYIQAPNEKTCIDFKLEYFNTASAKQIAKLLILFEELSQNSQVRIKWYYDKEDTDMLMSGKRYSKLINLDFEYFEN